MLPLSVQEVWDLFYADESLFYSDKAYAIAETLGYYSSWHDPSEAKFESFVDT